MSVEIVTKEDLQVFRIQLISELRDLLTKKQEPTKEWLRSSDVRKLLKISPGTLQNLRVSGRIQSRKIGGIYFYSYAELLQLLPSNISSSSEVC
ncbi:DNA-binding protein [Segetibacter sp. 3557_3]|uniref:helix-turn-helix domain-containing protein n=1 Tax=Segetibacter sp. 3557_3 TaxID=2547429 RepID=UPI0010586293|nr:helix-turn-helix domain-containing protein [Segetibacter sp. 3557_3]TDH18048.1 DNA-binding protein [Segetibacter sp. 3557_3]